MTTIGTTGFYLTTRQIAKQLDRSERHIRDIMHEMQRLDRYEPEDILEDSKMINLFALYDYLKYRKSIKAGLRVPEFDRRRWAEVCPIVERWRL